MPQKRWGLLDFLAALLKVLEQSTCFLVVVLSLLPKDSQQDSST
jgi:competence protein ComGF